MSVRSWVIFGVFVIIMGLIDFALCKIVSQNDVKEEENKHDNDN